MPTIAFQFPVEHLAGMHMQVLCQSFLGGERTELGRVKKMWVKRLLKLQKSTG